MIKAMTKGVTKPMTKPAPPVKQLALGRLRLGFELLAPVLERLLREAMNLAILALIQIATLPRLMMSPPERLAITLPGSVLVRHLALRFCKLRTRTDRGLPLRYKRARNGLLRCGCSNP